MPESRVEKKNFITCFLLLVGAVLLLTVYPLRLYKEDHVFQTGETVTEASGLVYDRKDAGAAFVAEYSHLQTLSVYIAEMPWQGDLFCNVYDLADPAMPKILTQETTTVTEDMVPGYATFVMDLDLQPGAEYTYIITGGGTYGGVFRMGFVNDEENAGDALPHLIHSIYHDSAVQGKTLISRYTYRMPIEKKPSFLLMGAYALVTLVFIFLLRSLSGKGKILQGTWSLREGMRYTFSPIILLSGGLLLYLIVIRQLFDHRIADITVFAVGTILTMAVLLFGLFRKALPHEKKADGKLMLVVLPEWLKEHGMHVLFSVFFALALHCTSEYMNGTSNIAHYIAEEKMLLFLALAFACTLRREDILNRYALIWIFQSLPFGIYYYLTHKLTPDMKEFEENNLLLRLLIYITVVTGVVLIGVARKWIRRFREGRPPRINKWFTAVVLLFFAVIVLFRYTRWWPVILVCTFLFWGDVCLSYEERQRTLTDIGRGVIFDFLYMAGFSMLHRLYLSYRFIRFPMGFHTVTVTAVYLTIVVGTAASFLIRKYWLLKKAGYRYGEILSGAWKEIVIFGMAITYLMMTMSRTGVLATFAVLFMLFLLFLFDRKEGRGILLRTAQTVGMMAMGLLLMILPVFSMQRMIPALASSPFVFELEEEAMMVEVLRGDRYDSTYYICLERYIQVFKEKFFGASEGDSDVLNNFDEILKRRDAWNRENKMEVIEIPEIGGILNRIDEGVPIEVIQEEQRKKKEIREAREIDPVMQQEMEARGITDFDKEDVALEDTAEEEQEKGDYSNGRRDIFRLYFHAIGLRGHEQMGYPLNENESIVHAHNMYLQSAYDHGVFGGILLLLLLFVAFLRAVMYYYKKKCDPETLSFLPMAMTVGFAVTGLVEWVFHLCNPISLLFFMCIIPLSETEEDG